jgi:hypothetical protein
LFGITVHDPVTFVAVPACLIAIALLAALLCSLYRLNIGA